MTPWLTSRSQSAHSSINKLSSASGFLCNAEDVREHHRLDLLGVCLVAELGLRQVNSSTEETHNRLLLLKSCTALQPFVVPLSHAGLRARSLAIAGAPTLARATAEQGRGFLGRG